jgi:hypothetical protein
MGATGGSSNTGGFAEKLLSNDNYYGERYDKSGMRRLRQIVGDAQMARNFYDKITENTIPTEIGEDERYGTQMIRRDFPNGDYSTFRERSREGGAVIENFRVRNGKKYLEKIHFNEKWKKPRRQKADNKKDRK